MALPKHDPIRAAYVAQEEQNLAQLLRTRIPPQRFTASELGHCKRRIWYRHAGYIPSIFTARGSDYGRDGNMHHDLVRTFMVDMGGAHLEEVSRGPSGLLDTECFAKDVTVQHKGLSLTFHARVDGVIKLGRSKLVLEIKSVSNKDYYEYNNTWTRTVDPDAMLSLLYERNIDYVYQTHVGMFATKLKQAYVVLKGRDNACTGFHSQRDPALILGGITVPWKKETWTVILNRAALVQKALNEGSPPRPEFLKSSKQCKYCSFLHLCHDAEKRRKRGVTPFEVHPQLGPVIHVKDL